MLMSICIGLFRIRCELYIYQYNTYIHTYIHTYTHTHTHTYIPCRYMNLQACPKTFHITVHPIHSDQAPLEGSWPPNSVCYKVEGVAVGTAYLAFNTTTVEGRVISSPPKEIQVFDPLNLQPDNITLLPTATFQVCVKTV